MISDDNEENKTTDEIDETQTSEEGDVNEFNATATAAPQTPPRATRYRQAAISVLNQLQ